MSNEIEIGEYIRTNEGLIGKIKRIDFDEIDKSLKWYIFDHKEPNINIVKEVYINKPYIVKHSKNIIDLIEKGDFVNERLVLQVDYKNKNVCLLIPFTDTKANTNIMWYGYEDIKSIVTKEQFANMEYKVGV